VNKKAGLKLRRVLGIDSNQELVDGIAKIARLNHQRRHEGGNAFWRDQTISLNAENLAYSVCAESIIK